MGILVHGEDRNCAPESAAFRKVNTRINTIPYLAVPLSRCLFLQLLICVFPRMGYTNAARPLHLAWSCGPLLPLLNRHHGLVPPADEIGISVAWLAGRTSRLATAPPKPLQTDRGLRQIIAPRFIWAWMAEEWQLSCWAGVPRRWPMWA